jgi:D-arabinitol dehydrogenase (NADP+)
MADEADRLALSPYDVFRRELTVKGSFAQSFSFDRAVLALRSGRVRADGLITHRFGLGSYSDAVHAVREDRSCVKAVVEL